MAGKRNQDPVPGSVEDVRNIMAAAAEDMPSDADLELMSNGLAPDGSWMSTGDIMYDGTYWDPDLPPLSQIPLKEWPLNRR
jgi:hypothetical protein